MDAEADSGGACLAITWGFFCNRFEELETVLFEVELIINNAPVIYVYPNTIENMFNTQSFVIWQTVITFF